MIYLFLTICNIYLYCFGTYFDMRSGVQDFGIMDIIILRWEKEVTLRWVEIINVRLNSSAEHRKLEHLFRDIRNNISETTDEGLRIVFYKGGVVDSDWAIHLNRETDDRPSGRTELGIKLAYLIRPLAMVDHSIWVEEVR